MDKYHGVYVKIALANNDIIKGHIHGKDKQGNLILKDCKLIEIVKEVQYKVLTSVL
jgi:small nuclear ribonucleoprotein (snRNP)-like protein